MTMAKLILKKNSITHDLNKICQVYDEIISDNVKSYVRNVIWQILDELGVSKKIPLNWSRCRVYENDEEAIILIE